MDGLPSSFLLVFFFFNTRATGPYRFLLVLIFVVFACSFFFPPLFALSLYIEQLIRKRGKVEKKSVVTAPLEAEVVVVVMVVFLFFFFSR